MSLRLSSLSASAFAAIATLFLAAACTTPAVIAGSTGGAGGGAGGSTTEASATATGSTSATTSATTSTSTGGGACTTSADCGCGCGCVANACECTGAIPPSCAVDTDCGPACAGLSCIAGMCVAHPCDSADPCPTEGATRCTADSIQTCTKSGACQSWTNTSACPMGESCNSDATKCVAPTNTCAVSADCGCGCGCVANACACTGAIPPSCTTDDECGPACAGFHCIANKCVAPN